MSHTEGSSAKIVKVVKFHLCDIYDSMMFRPILDQHKDSFRMFSLFQQELIQFIASPALQRLGFANFRNHNSFWEKSVAPLNGIPASGFRSGGRNLFRFGNRPVLIVEIMCVENVVDKFIYMMISYVNVSYSTLFYYDQYSM